MVRGPASVGNGIRRGYPVGVPANASSIPVVDLEAFAAGGSNAEEVAAKIGNACRNHGFFYVVGHGVRAEPGQRLERLSRQFFSQDLERKMAIRMERGGRAWRGYFPVGAELTLTRPDQKEGLYFGAELQDDHPKVASGVPLHGQNLFPDIPGFRRAVLDYIDAMTRLGHTLMEGLARSLGLDAPYFAERYTRDPLILFRIFNYPPPPQGAPGKSEWGVGEHTDYGVLTILRQDDTGGLEVKTSSGWIDAPPIPGSFVCNIGDMLDRMTGGLYRSTPHRVRNRGRDARLSFPFFFDPNFDATVRPIDLQNAPVPEDKDSRWDRASVHKFRGTYGEYLLGKVSKVFPELGQGLL